jgi:hypothetical protein
MRPRAAADRPPCRDCHPARVDGEGETPRRTLGHPGGPGTRGDRAVR